MSATTLTLLIVGIVLGILGAWDAAKCKHDIRRHPPKRRATDK